MIKQNCNAQMIGFYGLVTLIYEGIKLHYKIAYKQLVSSRSVSSFQEKRDTYNCTSNLCKGALKKMDTPSYNSS